MHQHHHIHLFPANVTHYLTILLARVNSGSTPINVPRELIGWRQYHAIFGILRIDMEV